jgi:hypothetical protein
LLDRFMDCHVVNCRPQDLAMTKWDDDKVEGASCSLVSGRERSAPPTLFSFRLSGFFAFPRFTTPVAGACPCTRPRPFLFFLLFLSKGASS